MDKWYFVYNYLDPISPPPKTAFEALLQGQVWLPTVLYRPQQNPATDLGPQQSQLVIPITLSLFHRHCLSTWSLSTWTFTEGAQQDYPVRYWDTIQCTLQGLPEE